MKSSNGMKKHDYNVFEKLKLISQSRIESDQNFSAYL